MLPTGADEAVAGFGWSQVISGAVLAGFTILGFVIQHLMESRREARRFERDEKSAAERFARERKERNDGLRRAKLEELSLELIALRARLGEVEKAFYNGANAVDTDRLDISHLSMLAEMYIPAASGASELLTEKVEQLVWRVRPILGGASSITDFDQLTPLVDDIRQAVEAFQLEIANETRRILLGP